MSVRCKVLVHCWLRMHPRRDCMFVAVSYPGVRRQAFAQGANKCICDRLKVGRDRRSSRDPLLHGRNMHSFALRTTARRGTPGSRTATNSRAGCSEPAVYWSLASNLFTSHWGHHVSKHPTGCPTHRPTEEQWDSLRPSVMAKTYV